MACWKVVGGAGKGGIIVRDGRSLDSQKELERLSTGAFIRELSLQGGRLHYELISGSGPQTGWVSVTFEGKELLQQASEEPLLPQRATTLDPLPPLLASKWVAKYQHSPRACCRLLCAFGAGADASGYGHWNAVVSADFPEVDLILLQLPGRGVMRQQPLQRQARTLAKLIVEELLRLEGIGAVAAAPLALLGFSMGAALLYEVELQLEAVGRQSLRLYVAGRAGPGIKYRHPQEASALAKTPAEYVSFFASSFCPPEIQTRLLKLVATPEQNSSMLQLMRDMYCADLELGNSLLEDSTASLVPVSCSIHVVASRRDSVWPAFSSEDFSVACMPAYDDIVETWRDWTTQDITSTIFEELEHYELCGEKLLRVVCGDLREALGIGNATLRG